MFQASLVDQPADPAFRVGEDGDDQVVFRRHPFLHEQRHVVHGDGIRRQGGELFVRSGPDPRVGNRLEVLQCLGVGKGDARKSGTVQRTIGKQHARTKTRADLEQGC